MKERWETSDICTINDVLYTQVVFFPFFPDGRLSINVERYRDKFGYNFVILLWTST